MILLFSQKISNRLRFSSEVLADLLGVEISLTDREEDVAKHSGPVISYGINGRGISIPASGLINETGIKDQNVQIQLGNPIIRMFKVEGGYTLDFDLFSSIFYLVTRYEEYLPSIRDDHGRFKAEESVAYKNNFLQRPVVNEWALWFMEVMKEQYPDYRCPGTKFKYISTIDIDNAFAYKEKGVVRTVAASLKDFVTLHWVSFIRRFAVLFGGKRDPFDTFDHMHQLHQKYGLRAIYFFLLADYGTNDKNVNPHSRRLHSVIKSVADYNQVGIHPSYGSNTDETKLPRELRRLREIVNRDVTCSRQHFLMIRFPETYRKLIDHDLTEDYSMGYPNTPGFRAGIASPFNFYDLEMEQRTELRIFPFCIMESSFYYYMNTTPTNAMNHIRQMAEAVFAVNGTLVTLWHNDSLSGFSIWRTWKSLYGDTLELINQLQNGSSKS